MSITRRQFAGLVISAAAATTLGAGPALAGGRKGTFKGLNGHVTSGHVTVKKEGGKTVVILGDDFFFDGAPDPKIAFGNGGKYTPGTVIHPLLKESNYKGSSKHVVPASINAGEYSEVYVWCDKFTVPLGIAKIK